MKNYLPSLDDMVFEHRNKLYGAFELRKSYADSLKKATLFGVAAMLFVTGSSFIYFKSQPKKETAIPYEHNPENFPPPVEKAKDMLPPPPLKAETPPPVKQRALLPPEPVPNELDIEEVVPPDVSELENAHIGKVDVEGMDAASIVFDVPPPAPLSTKEVKESGVKEVEMPFTTVEMMPEFVGGNSELYKWLGNNLRYPSAAINAGVEGKVFVKFIVEKDGTISKPQV